MGKKRNQIPLGYFDYVVLALEGLWWFDDNKRFFPENKSNFCWISLIRLPEFGDKNIFE
jgi:hypothetical protein